MFSRHVAPSGRRALALVCALAAGSAMLLSSTLAFRRGRAEGAPTPADGEDRRARPRELAPVASAAPSVSSDAPSASPPPARLVEHATLGDELGRPIEIYPPLEATARAPIVVMLHATCMQPRPVCDLFGRAGREGTFLVCPSGNDTCDSEPDWHGSPAEKSAFLDRDLAAVDARLGASVDHAAGDVLIGWSRGAFAARDILYARVAAGASPRFHAVVFIAAAVSPDPIRFKAAGVRRVVLAAGDQDGSRPVMKRAAVVLSAAGIEARYVSLGPIGHWLPEDLEAKLRGEIVWARGADGGS